MLIGVAPAVCTITCRRLEEAGYVVDRAVDAAEAIRQARRLRFDAIIVDGSTPDVGVQVCREVRQAGFEASLLLLTDRRAAATIVAGLEIGADDYITRPFSQDDLLTRVEVLLRRNDGHHGPEWRAFGSVRVNVSAAETTRHGKMVNLFAREFRLLRYFIEHPGVTFSRAELLAAVWSRRDILTTRTVDVHVASLRRKLEDEPRRPKHFVTVHGLGYKFRP
jgi:DNA-binding response OmpR family regulator